MSTEPVGLDRRHRRRQETIEEVLDHAVAIMAEEGVAGLSLGEIARRMGIRTPSLYVYFPSKHALYDALFARGAQLVLDHVRAQMGTSDNDRRSLDELLLREAEVFVTWSLEHPAYTQLLFWRPVPGFAPSAEAYAPAVELVELTRQRFAALQQAGLVQPDADVDAVVRDWTVLISGVTSQQMSNAPDEPFATGRFTAALPSLVGMFARHYGTTVTTTRSKGGRRSSAPPTKETRRARER